VTGRNFAIEFAVQPRTGIRILDGPAAKISPAFWEDECMLLHALEIVRLAMPLATTLAKWAAPDRRLGDGAEPLTSSDCETTCEADRTAS
jgi:hypothetical protein